eukprot:CAMPEP_0201252296 /NCGR_PEP_ID=MMETSP0852-20130820/66836_1 /ASSEMBLY_ACC=CAM_ASM_000632 /TAXON_ID=183588 /ORGANISM="Pseudo-nitzschia fraudulenta, Strain WWA7" /LENGTH=174 /DNA_ID=CAMNT_0047551995 /DNA_START=481 /DNA_END=1006 /DNA_ORIENTATION=-
MLLGNGTCSVLKPSNHVLVTDEPRIPTYQPAPAPGAQQQGAPPPPRDLRGDVAVHCYWRRGTTAVFDVHITDTDCSSYYQHDPANVLRSQEHVKKRLYGKACRQAHHHFTSLVYSVDGMEEPEAKAARKQLATKLSAKWEDSTPKSVALSDLALHLPWLEPPAAAALEALGMPN